MSYIDDLNDAAARAQVAADTAEGATQILYDVANGDDVTTVTTESGEVKTVAKAIADIEAMFSNALYDTATEEFVLEEGQTSISLTSVSTDNMSLYIEGAREFDYTIVDSSSITLSEGFPEGTRIWVVGQEFYTDAGSSPVETEETGTQRSLTNWVSGQVYTYQSVEDMLADTNLQDGDFVQTLGYYSPGDAGGNQYEIVITGSNEDGGSYIDFDRDSLTAKGLFPTGINVRQFGAVADGETRVDEAFIAAATYANSVFEKGDGQAQVHIPHGDYSLEEEIDQDVIWYMDASASMTGSGGVEPSYVNDGYRLGGIVHRWIGTKQANNLVVGDPAWTVQKLLGKATTGAILGMSTQGSPGVCGVSYGSATESDGQSCMGVKAQAVNDPNEVDRGVWGGYIEGYNMTGSTGNATGCEVVIHNGNGERPSNIYRIKNGPSQQTLALWLTTTGSNSPDTEYYHNTAAIGIAPKDEAAFLRGILFHDGSVPSWDAIAMPHNYYMAWYTSSGTGADTEEVRTGQITSGYYNMEEVDGNPVIRGNRYNSSGASTAGNRNALSIVGQGNDGDTNYTVSGLYFIQSTDFVDGVAGGQAKLSVRKSSDELFVDHTFKPTSMHAGDNQASLGEASNRYTQVYATASAINTSDEREKQQIEDVQEAELRVGASLKIRRFKWNEAVEEKGDDARVHFGFIAQEVIAAFEAEGLDAFDYGCVCYDEWDEEVDEDGVVTKEAGNRYGIRYDECYALMMAAKLGLED